MDKIGKALQKLTDKEQVNIKNILLQIKDGDLEKLDVKKLKGQNNIFRVRKGKLRIIFKKDNDDLMILTIERRNDTTYKL